MYGALVFHAIWGRMESGVKRIKRSIVIKVSARCSIDHAKIRQVTNENGYPYRGTQSALGTDPAFSCKASRGTVWPPRWAHSGNRPFFGPDICPRPKEYRPELLDRCLPTSNNCSVPRGGPKARTGRPGQDHRKR